MTEPILTIHDGTTIVDIVRVLTSMDTRHKFLCQVILPDGTVCNRPAEIFIVPNSDCGGGVPYLGLQIRCEILVEDVMP